MTRIVGIEVVCGPIKTVLVYRTDQLVTGGANITIEMTRQALIDVSNLLRQRSLLIPRILKLQFDNCGDNKNKESLAFYSLLIEGYNFDEIEIAFLIVGHTHASIDHYFSVISRAIKKATFIGTPPSHCLSLFGDAMTLLGISQLLSEKLRCIMTYNQCLHRTSIRRSNTSIYRMCSK